MPPTKNSAVIFNSIPKGFPVLNEAIISGSTTIDLDNILISVGTLVKAIYLSIHPYLSGRMREAPSQAYVNEFRLGSPISDFGISKVIWTEKDGVRLGDFVYAQELHTWLESG
ncbi:hypothetical protein OPQ81_003588 [Rhizoctonia solani]|nr:hypothetical protein OPQ81_003588 [Rhizoctonia solani]